MRPELKFLLVLILVVASLIAKSESVKCTSLKNVFLMVHHRYGDPFNITSFSGCIERLAFNNKSLTEIYIRNQNVTDINTDTVRHMVRLKTILFYECPVQSISVGAFRNVPLLQNIQISYGNLTEIPAEVFNRAPALQLLRLNDNKIAKIEEEAFGGLENLKRIYMAKNELKVWKISWFVRTTNLEIIDFQKNKIEIIPRRAFYGMNKLKELYFDYNEVKTIETKAFEGIQQLDYLGLRYNRLTKIDGKVFPKKMSIESLFIDANYLNYLSDDVFSRLSVLEVTLDLNPWKCACLNIIHSRLRNAGTNLKINELCARSDIPTCVYSFNNSENCTENVDKQLTKSYIDTLKNVRISLDKSCARLD
ncbi:hypothetical protein WA026_002152 [Henosepilachna vigintioctopunctata]|uniref:Uncharacterized protein n=1 Tax=Henosepilachna vigintioctopunctata TaxID=420089 RepID=A0AAW1U342_9CUCU